MTDTGYILAITRGHNAGACLLKDGEIVFAVEEERLSRTKYDGGPFAAMTKVLDNLKASESSKKNQLYNLLEIAK